MVLAHTPVCVSSQLPSVLVAVAVFASEPVLSFDLANSKATFVVCFVFDCIGIDFCKYKMFAVVFRRTTFRDLHI